MTKEKGFTLLEMVIVLFIMAILSAMIIPSVYQQISAARKTKSTAQLDAIKKMLIGDPSLISNGERTSFGYLGDWGSLAESLDELIIPQTPAWQFNATKKAGAGWHGPYTNSTLDELKYNPWGDLYAYSNEDYVNEKGALVDAVIIDYGEDRVPSSDDKKVEILKTETTSNIHGQLKYSDNTLAKQIQVTIYYPMNGVITESATLTDLNGCYEFQSIPFGPRTTFYEMGGSSGGLFYVVDSATAKDSADNLKFNIGNCLTTDIIVTWLKTEYPLTAYYEEVVFNGTSVWKWTANNNRAASGGILLFNTSMRVPGQYSSNVGPHGTVYYTSVFSVIASSEAYIHDTIPAEWKTGGSAAGVATIELLRFKDKQPGGSGSAKPVAMVGTEFTCTFSDGSVATFIPVSQ